MEMFHVTITDGTNSKVLVFPDYGIAHTIMERAEAAGYIVSMVASQNDVECNVDDAWRKLVAHFDPEFREVEAIGAVYENLIGELPYLNMIEELHELCFTKIPCDDDRHVLRDERTGAIIDTGL